MFCYFYLFQPVFLTGCKKDYLHTADTNTENQGGTGQLVFNIKDEGIGVRSGTGFAQNQTVLGAHRQNPFTVERLAEAHRSLYNSNVQALPATDLYVKFMPASMEHWQLLEDTEEEFYDFPLEYVVVTMGDYYQEPGEGGFPVLYAVVPSDFVFPNVPHQIMASLNLSKTDPLLLAEIFYLTGNAGEIATYVVGLTGLDKNKYGPEVQARIPPEPECPLGYHAVMLIDQTTRPFTYVWECQPKPPVDPDPIVNGCGCAVSGNLRHPSGCIRVEDTELSTPGDASTFVPVRRVKVIAKDTWFTEDETWSNDQGCWSINKEYKGDGWFYVKFANDRCRIRGAEKRIKGVWEWITTKKHYVGKLDGPVFNNIAVNYFMWQEQGFRSHMYWGAATVNNALHEFHDYAMQDQIMPPENGLDIYIGRNHSGGMALMESKKYVSGTILNAMGSFLIWGIANLYLPDVYTGIDYVNSDRLKRLAYHELAHASHYRQVGRVYWDNLVYAEGSAIIADSDEPHGNEDSPGAGIIAVCESWAEHIGMSFAHRTYPTDDVTSIGGTWVARLEQTWNESQNHIPIGLFHDLSDIGEPFFWSGSSWFSACNEIGNACSFIDDQVSDFTNQQMFTCLQQTVTTVEQFRLSLIFNYLASTNNTEQQVSTLFNQN